jgi:2-polyprenyl-3-methyl-5-hydroxy-6-metoxy-1,4-benzoquinol methylase
MAVIESNKAMNYDKSRLSYEVIDFTVGKPHDLFDGVVSLDVIEHIDPAHETRFLENISKCLNPNGCCIIGTPNLTSQEYACENSKQGHINLKDHISLRNSLKPYFKNIFIFSMNDEVVHTGFYPMAHFLFAVGVGLRHN